jgi:hypothetical protein
MRVRVTTFAVQTRTAMALWEDQTPVIIATKGIVPRMLRPQHLLQQWPQQAAVIQAKHAPKIVTVTRTIAVYATWGIMDKDPTAVNIQANKHQYAKCELLVLQVIEL